MLRKTLLVLTCLLFLQAGQTQQRTEALKKRIEREYAWTKAVWTGDSKPYLAIQAHLDKMQREKQDMAAVARQFSKLTAKQKASDPQAVFRWAYAALLADNGTEDAEVERVRAMRAMGEVVSPHVYEFDRIRFILLCRDNPNNDLKGLGERLLKRRSGDYWVLLYQVYTLEPGVNADDRKRAFEICSHLTRALPKDPLVQLLVGDTWRRFAWTTQKKADANKAIAAYRKALDLMPTNNPGRQNVLRQIEFVQQDLRDYK